METIKKFLLIIILIFIFIFANKKEFFNNQGRKIYADHSGGKECNYISTNINNKGFACCTSFNNEKKYRNKCCVKVDKQNNCQEWDGTY